MFSIHFSRRRFITRSSASCRKLCNHTRSRGSPRASCALNCIRYIPSQCVMMIRIMTRPSSSRGHCTSPLYSLHFLPEFTECENFTASRLSSSELQKESWEVISSHGSILYIR